jgi:hypothetical protein
VTHLRDAAIVATLLAGCLMAAGSAQGEPLLAAGEAVFFIGVAAAVVVSFGWRRGAAVAAALGAGLVGYAFGAVRSGPLAVVGGVLTLLFILLGVVRVVRSLPSGTRLLAWDIRRRFSQ